MARITPKAGPEAAKTMETDRILESSIRATAGRRSYHLAVVDGDRDLALDRSYSR
jgi:hypothetical protein